jgi:hypothetical protein
MSPQHSPSATAKFIIGAVIGIVFSVIFYAAIAPTVGDSLLPLFGAVGVKLVVGLVLCAGRDLRPFGAGLLASIPIAVMIFMALCFGAFIVFSH